MNSKYKVGQKVIIRAANAQDLSSRECDIAQYAGQSGKITNYYWISPLASEIFYIYTVQIGAGHKEVVVYEDEIETYMT